MPSRRVLFHSVGLSPQPHWRTEIELIVIHGEA